MAMKTSHKWLIVIGAIIVLAIIGYFIYKAIPKQAAQGVNPKDTTTSTNGVIDTALSLYCKAFPNSKVCGGKKGYVTVSCDPDRPGYNTDGLYDNNCQ